MTISKLLQRWRSSRASSLANSLKNTNSRSNTGADITQGLTSFGLTTYEPLPNQCLAEIPQVQNVILRSSIERFLTQDYVDITQVRAMLDMLGRSQNTRAFDMLRALHCVHWNEMNRDTRELVPHLLNEALRGPQPPEAVVDSVMEGVL